jgi:pyruvate formate lyase activating enzyme
MEWDVVRDFLISRVGILHGVCITGGEPTLHNDLTDYLAEIKDLGFLVKLDTNGTRPEILVDLVDGGLVDYVALDVKNSPQQYDITIGIKDFEIVPIATSIEFLLSGGVDYEFRTTVVQEFHDEEGLLELAKWIRGAKRYYLQTFVDSDQVLQKDLHPYSPEEMRAFAELIKPIIPGVEVRGI